MKNSFYILIFVLIGACISCSSGIEPGTPDHIRNVTESVNYARILAANENFGDWLSYGRNYQEDRFSHLGQINKSNLDSLGLDCSINLGTTRGK